MRARCCSYRPLQSAAHHKVMGARTFWGNSATNHPGCDGIDPVKAERNNMRNALLAVAGAALMGTVLVGPACSEAGRALGGSAIAELSDAIRLDPKNAVAYGNR